MRILLERVAGKYRPDVLYVRLSLGVRGVVAEMPGGCCTAGTWPECEEKAGSQSDPAYVYDNQGLFTDAIGTAI